MINLLFVLLALFVSCSHPHGKNHANQHMHKKTHAELIESFSNPARDEWQKPQLVLQLMGKIKNKTLIDIGSGSGYFTHFFLKAQARVTAADVDDKFLNHIKESFPKENYPKLIIHKMTYSDPLMGESAYDVAFTANTYHHIENRSDYFKKVLRGLKVGGSVVVHDFKADPVGGRLFGPPLSMRIPVSRVVEELMAAGFQKISVDNESFAHQYFVVGTRTK